MLLRSGGDISAWRAAEIVLGGRYTDKRMFIVDTGKDGGGAYVRLWELGIYWIGDTLATCIQVNPLLL